MNIDITIKKRVVYEGRYRNHIVWIKVEGRRSVPVFSGTAAECVEFTKTLRKATVSIA